MSSQPFEIADETLTKGVDINVAIQKELNRTPSPFDKAHQAPRNWNDTLSDISLAGSGTFYVGKSHFCQPGNPNPQTRLRRPEQGHLPPYPKRGKASDATWSRRLLRWETEVGRRGGQALPGAPTGSSIIDHEHHNDTSPNGCGAEDARPANPGSRLLSQASETRGARRRKVQHMRRGTHEDAGRRGASPPANAPIGPRAYMATIAQPKPSVLDQGAQQVDDSESRMQQLQDSM